MLRGKRTHWGLLLCLWWLPILIFVSGLLMISCMRVTPNIGQVKSRLWSVRYGWMGRLTVLWAGRSRLSRRYSRWPIWRNGRRIIRKANLPVTGLRWITIKIGKKERLLSGRKKCSIWEPDGIPKTFGYAGLSSWKKIWVKHRYTWNIPTMIFSSCTSMVFKS